MNCFKLAPLSFPYDALEPIISKETLFSHHQKHHQSYVDNLNELIPGSDFEDSSLDEIVMHSSGAIFEQAAQVWNHDFYWNSISPDPACFAPEGRLRAMLAQSFGSLDQFRLSFEKRGASLFGSGWVWLVFNPRGSLQILTTKDAGNPLCLGLTPLLVCDVWEHAYYLDYQSGRAKYLSRFFDLIDWERAEARYDAVTAPVGRRPENHVHYASVRSGIH